MKIDKNPLIFGTTASKYPYTLLESSPIQMFLMMEQTLIAKFNLVGCIPLSLLR